MLMIELSVGTRVEVSHYRDLVDLTISLPCAVRPVYFTVGERVRNKSLSLIEDDDRFSSFVDEKIRSLSGFDLIGDKIRFGFFTGETRSADHVPTHVGCVVSLRSKKWLGNDAEFLLRALAKCKGTEWGYACLREEWEHRHLYIKRLPDISIQTTLGVDMSSYLPGIYWWTVLSDRLRKRHCPNIRKLTELALAREMWSTDGGDQLHAFRLYDQPTDWKSADNLVSAFLKAHDPFFSMANIEPLAQQAMSKAEFDNIVRQYRAGAVPWEAKPGKARWAPPITDRVRRG